MFDLTPEGAVKDPARVKAATKVAEAARNVVFELMRSFISDHKDELYQVAQELYDCEGDRSMLEDLEGIEESEKELDAAQASFFEAVAGK